MAAVFKLPATALDDFRVRALHGAPTAQRPDLASAQSDAASGHAMASIATPSGIVHSEYPADRAIDAVSAVLMTASLGADFDFRRSIGAHTDLVLAMPTRRFYISGDAVTAPFGLDEYRQRSPSGTLCTLIGMRAHGRNGNADAAIWSTAGGSPGHPEQAMPKPCHATTVFALDPATRPRSLLGSELPATRPLRDGSLQSGSVDLDMNFHDPACDSDDACPQGAEFERAHANGLRPDLDGRRWYGLPAIGFAATGFVNENAGGTGVLGNYTHALPFRRMAAQCAVSQVGDCR